jgi:hypothetical protein
VATALASFAGSKLNTAAFPSGTAINWANLSAILPNAYDSTTLSVNAANANLPTVNTSLLIASKKSDNAVIRLMAVDIVTGVVYTSILTSSATTPTWTSQMTTNSGTFAAGTLPTNLTSFTFTTIRQNGKVITANYTMNTVGAVAYSLVGTISGVSFPIGGGTFSTATSSSGLATALLAINVSGEVRVGAGTAGTNTYYGTVTWIIE